MKTEKELKEELDRKRKIAQFLWDHLAEVPEEDESYEDLAAELRTHIKDIQSLQYDISVFRTTQ